MALSMPKKRYTVSKVVQEVMKSSDEQTQSSDDEPDMLLPDGEMSDSALVW